MAAPATVRVRVVDATGDGDPRIAVTVIVPHATPAGAAWSHLPIGEVGDMPPPGLVYRLNGARTLPAAWLADGDLLELVLPPVDG